MHRLHDYKAFNFIGWVMPLGDLRPLVIRPSTGRNSGSFGCWSNQHSERACLGKHPWITTSALRGFPVCRVPSILWDRVKARPSTTNVTLRLPCFPLRLVRAASCLPLRMTHGRLRMLTAQKSNMPTLAAGEFGDKSRPSTGLCHNTVTVMAHPRVPRTGRRWWPGESALLVGSR